MRTTLPGLFVNREGLQMDPPRVTLVRVEEVDERGAKVVKLDGTGSWVMPRAEYDRDFGRLWRPATPDDVAATAPAGYRPPAEVPDDWAEADGDDGPARIGPEF